ncbi:MAG: type II toxin-antitoxin system VapC family toxin [Saprospiraceae bacterium]|nr:MAG: type II toxin-antitoxin system VapC family toxin [Saprospiraceae bacterium]
MLDFKAIAVRFDNLFVSAITYIETLGFQFANPNEKAIVEAILNSLTIVQTDMDIVLQVVAYKQIRKIKTPDAIILATAKLLDAELVTVNDADFKGLDAKVGIFVPDLILP